MSIGSIAVACHLALGAALTGVPVPYVAGDWWTVATNPDLGDYGRPDQQPVDFAVWQAADGTWQLWSCIRNTNCGGVTRLFYRWEGKNLTDTDWTPMGIAMQGDPKYGERLGGLQAPHVVRIKNRYHMFYGDWDNICMAVSDDGKTFERVIQPNAMTGMFTEGKEANARDAMVLFTRDLWHCYYTAFPDKQGAVYCRTTTDFVTWSDPHKVAFGGEAGTGICDAECPHVVELTPGDYYLFRTQRYGHDAETRVYYSKDPLNFGIDNDAEHLVTLLPVAAPEIVFHEGKQYIACLLPNTQGIRIAPLGWKTPEE